MQQLEPGYAMPLAVQPLCFLPYFISPSPGSGSAGVRAPSLPDLSPHLTALAGGWGVQLTAAAAVCCCCMRYIRCGRSPYSCYGIQGLFSKLPGCAVVTGFAFCIMTLSNSRREPSVRIASKSSLGAATFACADTLANEPLRSERKTHQTPSVALNPGMCSNM